MNESNQINKNDGIDLDSFINNIYKRKILIGSITIFSIIFSCIYSIRKTKVWQGEFQIVISQDTNRMSSFNDELSQVFKSIDNTSNQLKTEVEILKSPSVLMKVFDNYKLIKYKESPKYENLNFRKWLKKNLDIRLIKSTNVLNLVYRDTNKKTIIPVLNDIAEVYKQYSIREKEKGLNESINYLNNQIDIFKEKIIQSSKEKYNYDKENGLFEIVNEDGEEIVTSETLRIKATNKLNKILLMKNLYEKAEENNNLISIYNLSSSLNGYAEFKIFEKTITNINQEINKLDSIFIKDTKKMKRLKELKEIELNSLKNSFSNYLNVQESILKTQIKKLTKSSDVIARSINLRNNLIRNKKTLKYLSELYQFQTLEQKKNKDTWDLITSPTLLDYPVAPLKKRIVFIGSIIGFLMSLLISKLIDLYKNEITDKNDIFKTIGYEPIIKLDLNNYNILEFKTKISEKINEKIKSNLLNILLLGKLKFEEKDELQNIFKSIDPKIKIKIMNDINEIDLLSLDLMIISEYDQSYKKLQSISNIILNNFEKNIPYIFIKKSIL